MSDYKSCRTCKQTFPATPEFFPFRNIKGQQRLQSDCRDCWRASRRAYNAAHPELKKAARKRRDPAVVAAEKKRSHERCRQKNNERARKWHRDNLESARQKARDSYYANREKYIALAGVNTIKRMARKRSLPDAFTKDDWDNCLVYWNHTCAVCGRTVGFWHTLAMDHWIPLADPLCPGTIPTNIVSLCHGMDGCNNSKGDRNAIEWLTSRYGLRKAQSIIARIEAYFASLR